MKSERNTLGRRANILKMIEQHGKISVTELSEMYQISEVSVRNDLALLEKKGLLVRIRGGAIKSQPINIELNLTQKLKKNYAEKKRIGKKAIDFVQDGFSIVMDSGSTCLEVAKNLNHLKDIKLITNSLPIADICADYEGIGIIITGGELRADMLSLIGPIAEKSIQNFSCDLAIIGANSISVDEGLYTRLITEAALGQAMIKIARKVILVIDSSKFEEKSLVKICDLKDIDVVITDVNVQEEYVAKLRKMSIEVLVV